MTAEVTAIPRRSLVRGDLRDAEDLFTRPFPPNGGYWEEDGYKYQACYRCGINIAVKLIKKTGGSGTYDKSEHREFCRDCNHPTFLRAFEPDFYGKMMGFDNTAEHDFEILETA